MTSYGYLILVLALVLVFWVALGAVILRRRRADDQPTEQVTPDDVWCGECGETITGPYCRVTQQFDDPDGSGWAMTAEFHPDHCPVEDPDHVHAGT